MNTRLSLSLAILLISYNLSVGQELPQITPPSPNAASLGQYGDIPVSYYTGVPNISIPLYTINSGEIKLPISLSYHSSGIKVTQEASWVGLGWALNAGGVITRSIMDDDDLEAGYISDPPLPEMSPYTYQLNCLYTPQLQSCDELITELDEYHNSMIRDAKPDIFYYNFFGYSGKLFFEKGSLIAISEDQNNISFEYNNSTKQWTVVDSSGWKYTFGTIEYNSSASSLKKYPINSLVEPSTFSKLQISSWYLDKVESPSGDTINFTYENIGNYYSQVAFGEVRRLSGYYFNYGNAFIVNGEPGLCTPSNFIGDSHDYRVSVNETVGQQVLKRIDFKSGYLTFDSSLINRHDLKNETINGTYNRALSSIKMHDLFGKEQKAYFFNYSYFNNDKLNNPDDDLFLRLKLENLKEGYKLTSGVWQYKPAHQFTYNETALPSKTSNSTDFWGYYNGVNNENILEYDFLDLSYPITSREVNESSTTLINTRTNFYSYIEDISGGEKLRVLMQGANREPNFNYAPAGVLESIKYPTGGISKFEYRMHKYESVVGLYQDNIVEKTVTSFGTDETAFTISQDAFVFIEFDFYNHLYQSDPQNSTVTSNMEAVLEKLDGTDILKFKPSDEADGIYGNYNTDEMHANVYVALEPGTYKLKAKHGGYTYLDLNLRAKILTKTPVTSKYGGGLRIVNIDNYVKDDDTLLNRTQFYYSGGKMMSSLQHFFSETKLIELNQTINTDISCCYDLGLGAIENPVYDSDNTIKSYNSSVIPLGSSAMGYPIGYDNVTVSKMRAKVVTDPVYNYSYITQDSPSQKSKYNYINKKDEHFGKFFPNLPTKSFLENGKILKEEIYSDDIIVRTKEFSYESENPIIIYGLSTLDPDTPYKQWDSGDAPQPEQNYHTLHTIGHFYEVRSEWWRQKEMTETIYDTAGNNPVITTTIFNYDNAIHKMPTETIVTNSKNEEIITKVYYPDDVLSTTTLGEPLTSIEKTNIDLLKSLTNNPIGQHRIVEPIQTETTVKNALGQELSKSTKRTNYKNWGSNLVLPEFVQTLKGAYSASNTLVDRVQFDSYYSNGNLKEVSKTDGTHIYYIWGYQEEYPIAMIENFTTAQAIAIQGLINTAITYSNNDNNRTIGFTGNEGNLRLALNNIRNHSSLSNAMVTTYTYDPLIGVTSVTDPKGETAYYEYDEYNRLKQVKDAGGKILSANEYHFKNQ